jgi:spermidine synthase
MVTAKEPEGEILHEKNSLYQYILVVEDTINNERYIFNNKREFPHGGIDLDAPEKLLFEYTQMAFISVAFIDREPKDVLFVGLGAGSMPQYFNKYYPGVNIDIAEIDPDMLRVAKKYFYFQENDRMKVTIRDGRMYIKRTPQKYDIIFLDAYQSGHIPFHLTTVEFLREVKKKLTKDGVVASNILSPFKNKFFDAMINTYTKEFPHLYIFKGRRSNNYIFIAATNRIKKEKDDISAIAKKIQLSKKLDIDLRLISLAYGYYNEFEWGTEILTDDFAPVNLYKYMKAR